VSEIVGFLTKLRRAGVPATRYLCLGQGLHPFEKDVVAAHKASDEQNDSAMPLHVFTSDTTHASNVANFGEEEALIMGRP